VRRCQGRMKTYSYEERGKISSVRRIAKFIRKVKKQKTDFFRLNPLCFFMRKLVEIQPFYYGLQSFNIHPIPFLP
jgi:hypothetical protein